MRYLLFIFLLPLLLDAQIIRGRQPGTAYSDGYTKLQTRVLIGDSISAAPDTTTLKNEDMAEGRMCYLKQLSSTNTNGGGWFVVIDSTYEEDGYNYFDHPTTGLQWKRNVQSVLISASNSTYKDKYSSSYSCDGINDEVQFAAAEAALPLGGKIKLTPGRFHIQAEMLITTNGIFLEGCGDSTIVQLYPNLDIGFDSTYNCEVSNIRFEAYNAVGSRGFLAQEVTDFTIDKCYFGDIDEHQLKIRGGSNVKVLNSTFRDSTFDGGDDHGLDFDMSADGGEGVESAFVIGNYFDNGGGEPLKFENVKNGIVMSNEWFGKFALNDDPGATTSCENAIISNNIIHPSSEDIIGFNCTNLDRGTVKFTHNILDSARIVINQINTDNSDFISTVEISHNTIQSWYQNSDAIDINGDGNILIFKNTLDDIATTAHGITVSSHDTGTVTITHNKINGGNRGVFFNGVTTKGTEVSFNEIYNTNANGFHFTNTKFTSIFKNKIFSSGGKGIAITNTCDTISICYNEVYSSTYEGIEVDSMNYLILANNQTISNGSDGIELLNNVNVRWEFNNMSYGNVGTDLDYSGGVIDTLKFNQEVLQFNDWYSPDATSTTIGADGDLTIKIDQNNNSGNDYFRIWNYDESSTFFYLNEYGNIGFNTAVFGDNAENVIGIKEGTAPTTSRANAVGLWVDNAISDGTASLFIRGEDGTSGAVLFDTEQGASATVTDTTWNNFDGMIPMFHPTLGDTIWLYYKLDSD